jgi:hypothetical protein
MWFFHIYFLDTKIITIDISSKWKYHSDDRIRMITCSLKYKSRNINTDQLLQILIYFYQQIVNESDLFVTWANKLAQEKIKVYFNSTSFLQLWGEITRFYPMIPYHIFSCPKHRCPLRLEICSTFILIHFFWQ